MREKKYKAWDGKEWRTSFVIHNTNGFAMIEIDGHLQFMKDWRVVGYTGLKDKNGKEIYEGDIIKDKFDIVKEIIFEEALFGFRLACGTLTVLRAYEDIEIIGNIYENPELLK